MHRGQEYRPSSLGFLKILVDTFLPGISVQVDKNAYASETLSSEAKLVVDSLILNISNKFTHVQGCIKVCVFMGKVPGYFPHKAGGVVNIDCNDMVDMRLLDDKTIKYIFNI